MKTKLLRPDLQDPLMRSVTSITDKVASLDDDFRKSWGYIDPSSPYYEDMIGLVDATGNLVRFSMVITRSSNGGSASLAEFSTKLGEFGERFKKVIAHLEALLPGTEEADFHGRVTALLEEYEKLKSSTAGLTPTHLVLQAHLSFLAIAGPAQVWPYGKDHTELYVMLAIRRNRYFEAPSVEALGEYLLLMANDQIKESYFTALSQERQDHNFVKHVEAELERYVVELETLSLMAVLDDESRTMQTGTRSNLTHSNSGGSR
jgi:hypothetical protein